MDPQLTRRSRRAGRGSRRRGGRSRGSRATSTRARTRWTCPIVSIRSTSRSRSAAFPPLARAAVATSRVLECEQPFIALGAPVHPVQRALEAIKQAEVDAHHAEERRREAMAKAAPLPDVIDFERTRAAARCRPRPARRRAGPTPLPACVR